MQFTTKALDEMDRDGIREIEVAESIVNARRIHKVLRAHAPGSVRREKLYVIKGYDYDGTFIYTKGKIVKEKEGFVFYVFISAKITTDLL